MIQCIVMTDHDILFFQQVHSYRHGYGSLDGSCQHYIEDSGNSTTSLAFKTYKRRWVVLVIFMIVNFMQVGLYVWHQMKYFLFNN